MEKKGGEGGGLGREVVGEGKKALEENIFSLSKEPHGTPRPWKNKNKAILDMEKFCKVWYSQHRPLRSVVQIVFHMFCNPSHADICSLSVRIPGDLVAKKKIMLKSE